MNINITLLCCGRHITKVKQGSLTQFINLSTSTIRPNLRREKAGVNQENDGWKKWFRTDTYVNVRKKMANLVANKYEPERVIQMGPDFACLEWLMNAGSRSVLMSDGTMIRSRKEMRKFLAHQGYDVHLLKKEAPTAELLKDFNSQKHVGSSVVSDKVYENRWRHISPIHMKEVDASDAVLTSTGCRYFLECRNIEKLRLNFCDYIDDEAISVLAQGRTAKSLRDLEIVFNPLMTDTSSFLLLKFKALQRLHLYFLPLVTKRAAVLRQLKIGLPGCKVTFPEVFFIGMGYESEQEKMAYQKTVTQKGFFGRFFG